VSGFCADGVCCDKACNDQCDACDGATTKGTCAPLLGAPHAGRSPCTVGAGTACGQQCNGVDPFACHYLPAGQPACSKNACDPTGGVETHASTCDGAGSCGDVPKSCGAFACGALSCNTTCASATDCAAGFICKSGACVAPANLGELCVDTASCGAPLFCTDGVCCGVASCGAGASCAAGAKKGVCAKTSGTKCTLGSECASGFCVDGVCCDAACDGQCQACDTAGSPGQCKTVSGAPHGARAACVDSMDCRGRVCDGSDPSKCAGFVGATRSCGAARCDADEAIAASTCDGSGGCAAGARTLCEPYACDATMGACKLTCAADTDCATDYECKSGKCQPVVAAQCSGDGLTSIAHDGTSTDCAPLRCGTDGRCLKACGSSDDCVAGTVCSAAKCISPSDVPTASSSSGGGCALGGRSLDGALFGCAIAALALTARRRHARR
jgi:hypothetical protein